MGMSAGSVKTQLDSVRRKLHCINLTHAVGVAVAAGVIPASALDNSGPSLPDSNKPVEISRPSVAAAR